MSVLAERFQKALHVPYLAAIVATLLTVVAVVMIIALVQSVQADQEAKTVLYGVEIVEPVERLVCPGKSSLEFSVQVEVKPDAIPDQVTIAESWCIAGINGPCVAVPPRGDDHMPLLAPKQIAGMTARDVPGGLRLGVEYEFHHSAASSTTGSVSGYIVRPIFISDDCP